MQRKSKLISIGFLYFLVMGSVFPVSIAEVSQINIGVYYWNTNIKEVTSISANWTVTSGSAIDVFLLTRAQLDLWSPNKHLPPPSAVYVWLSTTNGSFYRELDPEITYYAIFSNINGVEVTYADIQVQWTFKPAADPNGDNFLFIILVLSLVSVGGIVLIYQIVRRGRQEKQEEVALPLPSEFIYCIRCGSKNLQTAKFCKVCGSIIE